jgi:hypothetical protein
MVPALAAVPAGLRAAIAASIDARWVQEQDDYLVNCSNEPGGRQRAGHVFESMSRLRRFLEGNIDGQHVDTVVMVQNPVPEPGGYHCLLPARRKTVGEVHAELAALVGIRDDEGYVTVPGADDSFGPALRAGQEWPEGRIVVFPVTGGSEGWYVHVEVQTADGQSRLMILGKGFDSADAIWALARRLAEILSV